MCPDLKKNNPWKCRYEIQLKTLKYIQIYLEIYFVFSGTFHKRGSTLM